MASLRPTPPRAASYVRTRDQEKLSLQPQRQEHRSRSISRNPKPYSSDSPRHYLPNESRSRKPPQSPKVEDAGLGDDGVQMRGKPDQQPMIIDIASESESSDESPGVLTPEESSTETQSNHAHTNAEAARHHQQHKTNGPTKTIDIAKNNVGQNTRERGRRFIPRLDTELARDPSSGSKPIQLERERSPYAHSTKEPELKANRFSRDTLMSPDIISPQTQRNGEIRPRSQRPQIQSRHTSGSSSESVENGFRKTVRPSIERRASAMPHFESPTSARRNVKPSLSSSDESDKDATSRRVRSGHVPPALNTKPATSYFDTQRPSERRYSSRHPTSPPRTPLSPEYTKSPHLNRESLLNGAALQNLTTLLEAHHTNERKASPRASPAVSPYASPHPSPPHTPPQAHHSRAFPISNLKKDSPNSRTASPLSSAPSSPKASAPSFSSRRIDPEPKSRRPAPRSRATSPLPQGKYREPELMIAPKIDVRSPSPMPSKPESTHQFDAYMPQSPSSARHESYGTLDVPGSSNVPAVRQGGRQRSSSNAESHYGSRPSLAVKPPVIHQDNPSSDSPNTRYTPQAYLPTPSERASQGTHPVHQASASRSRSSSLLEPAAHKHRSQSTAPEPDQHSHRTRSAVPRPDNHTHRSRSSVPSAELIQRAGPYVPSFHGAISDESKPTNLPLCPRPDPVASHEGWYALQRYPDFVVCPDCRHAIFGAGYEHNFIRHSDQSRKKTRCALNEPWIRLACLVSFRKQVGAIKLLEDLALTTEEERACPESAPSEDRAWYHINDAETGQEFSDFQVCAHCVYSLEAIFPKLGDMFHRSKGLKDEPRVCALRSDPVRFGKYLNRLVEMAEEAQILRQEPDTSDFIWEVKWMTVISPCAGDQVLWGQDWHIHPELPELTVCEECYFKAVRPAIKGRSREAAKISGQSHEIKDGVSCKLFSPRMKQIFHQACKDEHHDELKRAVKKRNDLQQDMIKAQEDVQRYPRDRELQSELDELTEKWAKLAKRHD